MHPPAPCGAGRRLPQPSVSIVFISIHPPRAGRDRQRPWRESGCRISIHPPHAGRDRTDELDLASMGISIHPPHAGRDSETAALDKQSAISIHPPRAGRDGAPVYKLTPPTHFNPPAPCGAGLPLFQCIFLPMHFNPPAPCGAGRHQPDMSGAM